MEEELNDFAAFNGLTIEIDESDHAVIVASESNALLAGRDGK